MAHQTRTAIRTMHEYSAASVPVLPDWSSYAGEPFNLTERRPLTILSECDQQFVVEGFYHWGRFWTAVIPKAGVSEIICQRLNFSKPRRGSDGTTRPSLFFLNHVQARLKMHSDKPVRLYPAGESISGDGEHGIEDFTYSVEAVGPYGRRWNLQDALFGNLAVVHRFISTVDVTFERIVREQRQVIQSPPLPLEPALRDQMLHEAIRASHTTGVTQPYFMFRLPFTATNCTSEPLRMLDRVLRTPPRRRFFHRLPIYPRAYLQVRGLWQYDKPAVSLNEEMAAWLASDQVKERKHVHSEKKKSLPPVTPTRKVSLWTNFARLLRGKRG